MAKTNDTNKAKQGFLSRLKSTVSSHVYDLGKRILDEGVESAKENHDIELAVNKKMKDIIAEALAANKQARADFKASKDEFIEIMKLATKQSIAALKNDKESLTSAEDALLSELDINFDEFSDDDFLKMLEEDDVVEDESEDEPAVESMLFSLENITPELPACVSRLNNDTISAAILLIVAKTCQKEYGQFYREHIDAITNVVTCSGITSCVDEIETDSNDKTIIVNDMVDKIEDDMVPTASMESDEIIIVEEINHDVHNRENCELNCRIFKTLGQVLSSIQNCIAKDSEISYILNIADAKIQAVCEYIGCSLNINPIEVKNRIQKELVPSCELIEYVRLDSLAMVFYLGLVPDRYINYIERLLNTYYKVNQGGEY